MFLVCGEALFDVFVSPEADAEGRLGMQGVPGGSPFNVVIGLARLGTAAGLLAGLSEDPLGRRLEERLRQEGVATDYIVRRPERTTLSLVNLRSDGAPAYSFYGDRSADTSLSARDLPALGPEIVGLHLGSYSIVVPPVADAMAALAAQARSRLVTLDPNVRLGAAPDAAAWRARLENLLPHAGVVKASDEDVALLWPGRDIEEIAGDWLSRGPRLVVITRGPHGASAFHGGQRIDAAVPTVDVVDTVGAGDAFQSALIDGLLAAGVRAPGDIAGLSPRVVKAVLGRCVLAGAITCTRRGAAAPRRDELPPLHLERIFG
jgi:fructokinase